MTTFKVGDRIVRTGNTHGSVINGGEYVVEGFTVYHDLLLKGVAGHYSPFLFALAPPAQPKTVPHKHAELIKAWADGAEVEWRIPKAGRLESQWETTSRPEWREGLEYRIKPGPKPDVVGYGAPEWIKASLRITPCHNDCVQFTFDGETGKLKDAKVIL